MGCKSRSWLVDADGVLWVKNPVVLALDRVARDFANYIGSSYVQVIDSLLKLQLQKLLNRQYIEAFMWDKIVEEFSFKVYGDRVYADKVVKNFYNYFKEELNNVELVEGVVEVLHYAKSSGIRIVVISNGLSQYIKDVIKAVRLSKYIDSVVTPDTVGKYWVPPIKPFRPIFIEAMKRVSAREYIAIGDNLLFDGIGALRSGIDKVYIIENANSKRNYDVIFNLAESLDENENILFDGSIKQMLIWFLNRDNKKKEKEKNSYLHLGECIFIESWYDIWREESENCKKRSDID